MILEEQGGTFTGIYTYGVSLIRRNGEFFMYDGLGSARTFTNASGVVTAAATYDGYGNTVATSGSTSSPYQFGATSGHRNDGDAGIMQVGARYYDPATGSFLTRDTDLNQLAYVYCGDDPIDKVDPSGHGPLSLPPNIFKLAHEVFDWREVEVNFTIGSGPLEGVTIIGTTEEAVGLSQFGWLLYGYGLYKGMEWGYQEGTWFVGTPTGQQFTGWLGSIIATHLPCLE